MLRSKRTRLSILIFALWIGAAMQVACSGHRSAVQPSLPILRPVSRSLRSTPVPPPPPSIRGIVSVPRGLGYFPQIVTVASATPTGTPIPYAMLSQGTVGGFYTGGANCTQPDCGPTATWMNGQVPAGTTLSFTPNPAPINQLIPIALWSTTSHTNPNTYTTTGSWNDGAYNGQWSFLWQVVLPIFYNITVNVAAPSPQATPTMLYGLGPYSTVTSIGGNVYSELEGSYFARTPNPNTVANLDPTPMPTATQQERIDFAYDGSTPQPFGLTFAKSTLMVGRSYDLQLTWQTAYYDGTQWVFSGAIATAKSAQFPCDNLSNEFVNYYLGDGTQVDQLAIFLSMQTGDTLPAMVYSLGSNPSDKSVISIIDPFNGGVGPSIVVTLIRNSTYNLTFKYTSADTTKAIVASHLASAINSDPTARRLVSASASGPSVALVPVAPNYPGFPEVEAQGNNGANVSVSSTYTDATAWALGNKWPQDSIIFWWQASAHGAQTLFHELDHHYYEGLKRGDPKLNPFSTGCCTYTATLNLNGNVQKFTWDTAVSNQAVSAGYYAFEHLLIHNDLVKAYGQDTTGALAEAFQAVSPAPDTNQLSAINKQYASATVPIDQSPPNSPPYSGSTCPASKLLMRPNLRIPMSPPDIRVDVAY